MAVTVTAAAKRHAKAKSLPFENTGKESAAILFVLM